MARHLPVTPGDTGRPTLPQYPFRWPAALARGAGLLHASPDRPCPARPDRLLPKPGGGPAIPDPDPAPA